MRTYRAVATWTTEDYPGWEIDFPDGITEPEWSGTCTGRGEYARRDAEFMARDLVASHFDYKIRPETVKLSIKWKNERAYQRWHEREFGVRDGYR